MADPATGTIFDNPLYLPERPIFEVIAKWGDGALTVALLAVGLLIVIAAVQPKHPIFKAALFAWLILP